MSDLPIAPGHEKLPLVFIRLSTAVSLYHLVRHFAGQVWRASSQRSGSIAIAAALRRTARSSRRVRDIVGPTWHVSATRSAFPARRFPAFARGAEQRRQQLLAVIGEKGPLSAGMESLCHGNGRSPPEVLANEHNAEHVAAARSRVGSLGRRQAKHAGLARVIAFTTPHSVPVG